MEALACALGLVGTSCFGLFLLPGGLPRRFGSGAALLTEAVHRQVPQLRYARAERRGVERAAGEVAQQGCGGTRFVKDDLVGDPKAALHHGPSAQHCRRRAGGSGPGAGAAGLAAAQAFRSQLPQNAAEYVRLNVLPRPGQAQPPPQIIGRPSLLDEAWQRAQEMKRGAAQAVKETAVAAEEGEVAVAAKGVGGAFGYLGGLAEAALAPTTREVAGTLAGAAEVGAAATAGLAVGIAGGAAYGLARGTGWVLENTLFRPQQGSEDAAVQDVRSANNMNDATQPQHFTLRTRSSTSGSPASSRASSSGFRVQAHAAPLLLGPKPRGSAPVPELAGELQFRAVTPEFASAQL